MYNYAFKTVGSRESGGIYTQTYRVVPAIPFKLFFFVLGMRKEAQRDSQRLFYLIITATEERVFYTGIL